MMFKFAKTIIKSFALVALLAGTSFAFTEGTDYVKLAKPIPNAQGTLIKVFSYDCPFCYKYDKKITPNLVPKLPSDLKFRPFHLKTKGKYGVQGSELFAVLLLKDQKAGLSDRDLYTEKSLLKKAKMAYYTAYHDKKERWDAGPEAYLKTGLDAVGMSKAEFDKAKNDPKVKALLKEWDQSYDVAKIQGVPGFVVNGKYLVMTKSITSIDGMLKLINELKTK
ncbi:thiol:disulfide interchange protein DsbA/DsbL [Geomonas sp. Red259]|uniref:Thiol:disulfide interchange protein DsbA n=2 Tax=Geomonas propionica TaxID=2798582 RepID=A0ABS0YNK1_9BACT|nr:thiol:disulfide interchange protein DsbA/DsbL [Geomonas propionica]